MQAHAEPCHCAVVSVWGGSAMNAVRHVEESYTLKKKLTLWLLILSFSVAALLQFAIDLVLLRGTSVIFTNPG